MRPARLGRLGSASAVVALAATMLVGALPSASADEGPYTDDTSMTATDAENQARVDGDAMWAPIEEIAWESSALDYYTDATTGKPVLVFPADIGATEEKSAKDAIATQSPNSGITYKKSARFDTSELQGIIQFIQDNRTNLPSLPSLTLDYDPATDLIKMGTDATPAEITAMVGEHVADVVVETGVTATAEANRFDDYVTYLGGVALTNKVGLCTAGYALETDSRRYMTTAAHCYKETEAVWNQKDTADFSASNQVGSVIARYTNMDTEVMYRNAAPLAGAYTGRLWSGGTKYSTANIRVAGTTTVWAAMENLHVSGRSTYQHTNHRADDINFNICWSGSDACIGDNNGFTYDRGPCNCASKTAGGDSGAPIFLVSNQNTAFIAGHHAGSITWSNGKYRMVGVKATAVMRNTGAHILNKL